MFDVTFGMAFNHRFRGNIQVSGYFGLVTSLGFVLLLQKLDYLLLLFNFLDVLKVGAHTH